MKRARRILSHHGSDCPDGPHPFKRNRCIILTRVDHDNGTSEAWLSGDCAETLPMRCKDYEGAKSERLYRKRHTFASHLPTWYGGGFWERVELGPAVVPDEHPFAADPENRLYCQICGASETDHRM